MDAIADAVAERVSASVRVAYLDQREPSVHDVLDDAHAGGASEVLLVTLAVPRDRYLGTWLGRAVANWRETHSDAPLDIRVAGELSEHERLADAVADLAAGPGSAVRASPAAFRSPAFSELDIPERHLFACAGPRCTAYGSAATRRTLAEHARGSGTQVSPVGCLGPCNLGPLVIDNPSGQWHQQVDAAAAADLFDTTPEYHSD